MSVCVTLYSVALCGTVYYLYGDGRLESFHALPEFRAYVIHEQTRVPSAVDLSVDACEYAVAIWAFIGSVRVRVGG